MSIILKQQHTSHYPIKKQVDNVKTVLQSLHQLSLSKIDQRQSQDIKELVQLKQNRMYQMMLLTPKQYIKHQFTKLQTKQFQHQAVQSVQLFNKKFHLQFLLSKNKQNHIIVKNMSTKNNTRVTDFHDKVKQKLAKISMNIDDLGNSQSIPHKIHKLSKSYSLHQNHSSQFNTSLHSTNQRTQQQLQKLMQFKQPSYWLQQKTTQKSQQVKQFLQNHRKQQLSRQHRYNQQMEKHQQRIEEEEKHKHEERNQLKQSILKKGLQKTLHYKQQRETIAQAHQTRLQKIQQFLQNINPTSKRLYKKLQQQYKQKLEQQQKSYKEKLQKIKQQHTPIQQEQLQQHRQRYLQYKESLKEQLNAKKQQLKEKLSEVNQQLKSLFKSKQYDQIAQHSSISQYKRSLSQIIQRKSKKKSYAQKIKQNFKPQVSDRKRQQLEESIRLLEMSEDKSLRKVYKNGSVQYQDKVDGDVRKKGLEYLAYLRKYLQDKPRKQERPVSTSILQGTKIKKFDYLRESKPLTKLKESQQQWKKVINDMTFNPKDKYTFLKESVSTLEHKAFQKQIEARNLKKSPQQLEKKEQFDKLYLESIEAKMAILNHLMLGKKTS